MNLLVNNTLVILFNILLLLVDSALYLGSKEQFTKLRHQLPYSFFERFVQFWIIGMTFGIILIILNWGFTALRIMSFSKKQSVNLFLFSTGTTTICCFLGTSSFFWA